MFGWLKQRFVDWVDRYQKRELDRLHAEALRLKAEVLKMTGESRIRLTPEQAARLNAARKKIDAERLKQIDVLSDAE
jgi:hypothetical protein